jgi:hypothetical protein
MYTVESVGMTPKILKTEGCLLRNLTQQQESEILVLVVFTEDCEH